MAGAGVVVVVVLVLLVLSLLLTYGRGVAVGGRGSGSGVVVDDLVAFELHGQSATAKACFFPGNFREIPNHA